MKVSVVMATFDGERHVGEQVASILAGTRVPEEIVVVDDASSDATLAVVESALRAAPSSTAVRIERNARNIGPQGTFVRGLRATTGDIVSFCDQDDQWLPAKIARTEAAFRDHPGTRMAYGDGRIVDAALAPTGLTIFGTRAHARLELGASRDPMEVVVDPDVKGCTMGLDGDFARDLFARTDPSFANWWGHDHWAALFAHALGGVVAIREPLLLYRRHASNHSFARRFDATSLAEWSDALRVARRQGHGFYAERYAIASEVARGFGERVSPAIRDALAAVLAVSHHRRDVGGRSRWARLGPVATLYRSGFYGRYYNGALTMARDLLL